MKVWKCKQGVDFDKSTTTVKEERNRTLHQTKLSIIFPFSYIKVLTLHTCPYPLMPFTIVHAFCPHSNPKLPFVSTFAHHACLCLSHFLWHSHLPMSLPHHLFIVHFMSISWLTCTLLSICWSIHNQIACNLCNRHYFCKTIKTKGSNPVLTKTAYYHQYLINS